MLKVFIFGEYNGIKVSTANEKKTFVRRPTGQSKVRNKSSTSVWLKIQILGKSHRHGNLQNKERLKQLQPVTAAYGERLKLEEDIETHVLASIE